MQQPNNDKKPGLSWSTPASTSSNSGSTPNTAKTQTPAKPLQSKPTSSGTGSLTARYVGTFVGGLIVGVIVAWGWSAVTHTNTPIATANGTSTMATTDTAATAATTTTTDTSSQSGVASDVSLEGSELVVPSPQPAGSSVAIDKATVTTPTWVVVYDDNNGVPGNILGAQLFYTTGSGTVTLLRATQSGKTYLVGRTIDNGDHKFQMNADKPVTDASGDILVTSFIAQ